MRVGLLLLVCILGCGKAPLEPVPVAGRLVVEGKKRWPTVVLTFHPQDEANRRALSSVAPKPSDGTFQFTALPGRYKVTLVVPNAASPANNDPDALAKPEAEPSRQHPRYANVHDTPWSVEVPAGGSSDLVLKLQP